MSHSIKSERKSPDGYRLSNLFTRMQTLLPGKTVSSVLLGACDRKADAALLLEQILNWWEKGDDHVCNWTLYRGTGDRKEYKYMFLHKEDLADMWDGKTVPRRQLEALKSLGFLAAHAGYKNGVQGRFLRIQFRALYTKCFNLVEETLDQHQKESTHQSLLTRARTHAAMPFDVYVYQDLIHMVYQRAYENHTEKFLGILGEFNRGHIDNRGFRKELAKLDHQVGDQLEAHFEPERIEWELPKFTNKHQHASHRITAVTYLFTWKDTELTNTRWQLGMKEKPDVLKQIVGGELDLMLLQFIGVMFTLNASTRRGLNKHSLLEICNDLTSCVLYCYDSMVQQDEYNRNKFHPNQLIFNELFTLGWLESRVKFKHAIRGHDLLNKLIIKNRTYGETTSLQRLCVFGKLFPDETELIRFYVHESSKEMGARSVVNVYKSLTKANRDLLRAMYPLVFNIIETEAKCLLQKTLQNN